MIYIKKDKNIPDCQTGLKTTTRISAVFFLYASVLSVFFLFSIQCSNSSAPDNIIDPPDTLSPPDTIDTNAHPDAALINMSEEHQTIRGFGGMSCPEWVGDLTTEQAETAFGNEDGQLGFSMVRIRVPYDSANFSIALPTCKIAKSHGAEIIAAVWTPPPHMKSNNDTVNGFLLDSYFGEYAAHLQSYCEYMKNNDLPLYALAFANEPDYDPPYESCAWDSINSVNFLRSVDLDLGETKLIAGESFAYLKDITDTLLKDSVTEPKISIIATHLYGGEVEPYALAQEKGKEVWMTEHFTNTNDPNGWIDAIFVGREMHRCMGADFCAYLWWYIRRSYGPMDEDGNITKRGYVMAHYSKFVRPGYIRVGAADSPQPNLYVTAYKNGNDGNNTILVVINKNEDAVTQEFRLKDTKITSFTKYTTSETRSLERDESEVTASDKEYFETSFDGMSITTLVGNAEE